MRYERRTARVLRLAFALTGARLRGFFGSGGSAEMTTNATAIGPSSVIVRSICGLMTLRRERVEALSRAAGQRHGRPAGRQVDHAHVAPPHAAANAGAERLGAGLLGGEALGVGLGAVLAALGLGALDVGEDARRENGRRAAR